MQKFDQIQRFKLLPEGQSAVFYHPAELAGAARQVKFRVNAPRDVNLYLTLMEQVNPETGEVEEDERFLAHVAAGSDNIEFYYNGSFALTAMGSEVWLDTYDNAQFSVEAIDETNYARMWEREERDPRILEMEQIARHNRRLFDEQRARDRAEYDALMEDLRKAKESMNVVTGENNGGNGTPVVEPPLSGVSGAADTGTPPADGNGNGGQSNA